MSNLLLAGLINGTEKDLGQGALVCVLAILLVFAILAIIIVVTYLIGKGIEKYSKKEVKPVTETVPSVKQSANTVPVKLDDEDAIVATLVASIDFRQQTKKDIKVISVKESK